MLLKHPSTHSQSLQELKRFSSVHSVQAYKKLQLPNNSFGNSQKSSRQLSKEFVPFCQQRDLGKLLSNKNSIVKAQNQNSPIQKLLQMVNFKNFKKLYNLQKQNQQVVYALKTRIPNQKNLIKENQWIVNDIRRNSVSLHKRSMQNLPNQNPLKTEQIGSQSSKETSPKKFQPCRKISLSSKNITSDTKKSYSKMNLQLYKKMSACRPPSDLDPQLNTFYEHYVQSCELNENERRRFLTMKKV